MRNIYVFAGVFGLFSSFNSFSSDCKLITHDKSRLQCYDEQIIFLSVGHYKPDNPPADNPIHEAVDRELAGILVDPLSAINYEVSDPAPCRKLLAIKNSNVDKLGECVCYSVNSKNKMGGYTGDKLGVMGVVPMTASFYMALNIDITPDVGGCYDRHIAERPASNIHRHVTK